MAYLTEIILENESFMDNANPWMCHSEDRRIGFRRKRGCKSRHIHLFPESLLEECLTTVPRQQRRSAGPRSSSHISSSLLLFSTAIPNRRIPSVLMPAGRQLSAFKIIRWQ